MKKLSAGIIIATCVFSLAPSYAKSLWLKCGEDTFNLDSEKQQYNTVTAGKVIQGKATYFPGQINFQVLWYEDGRGGGLRADYAINRKTLEYTRTSMSKMVLLGDIDWKQQSGKDNPATTSGVCKIIPNPIQGNKI